MKDKFKGVVIAAAAVTALAIGGAAIATAGGGENEGPDVKITGSDLDRASAVALKHTGGGRVSDTEVGDEEGAYEVEVTKPDGSQVDVHLDENFEVLGSVDDEEEAGDKD